MVPQLTALLIAVLLASLAGCAKREKPVESGLRDQILHFGNGSEPQDLDPQTITGVPEHKLMMAVLEGLVSEDPRTLEPEPAIADEWKVSEDGLTYTFHIRETARWSNGDPILAPDIVASFKRILTPSLAAEYAYMIHHVVGAQEFNEGKLKDFTKVGFTAPDDRTFVMTLKHPVPFLLKAMASHYAWWPVHIPTITKFGGLERKGSRWTLPGNFVGSGPFVLKAWMPNQKIIVAKSPTYWDRERVRLNEIHFYAMDNIDVEERMFRTGQLHITNEAPNSKIDAYRRDNPDVLSIAPYLGAYFYRFNTSKPPFNDPRVRRAFALAINRDSIVANVTRGGQRPSYGVVPPGILGYVSDSQLTGTVEDARRLMAEAGFPDGKNFPRVELLYNTSENHRAIAEAIQQMWRLNLGVDVGLTNQEWKVYLDSQDNLAYDISRSGWIADYVDPHVFLDQWKTGGGNNDTGWSNARYDALLEQSLQAPDITARYDIYRQMEKIVVDELPILPIYFYMRVTLRDPMVKGYYPTVLDNHPWKYVWLEK
jgi:oligopeptide transport system substrate-binding protein